jgi:hypothetical protein
MPCEAPVIRMCPFGAVVVMAGSSISSLHVQFGPRLSAGRETLAGPSKRRHAVCGALHRLSLWQAVSVGARS